MDKKLKKARNYDQFVQEYFLPVYPVVADKALERSGVLSGVLLDIGCGGGYLGMELMKRADFEGVFLDIDEASLSLVQERMSFHDFRGRTVLGDVHSMPFADGSFDLVVSRGSMPFWKDQDQAIREIWRVLSPAGKAYIGVGYGSAVIRKQIRDRLGKSEGELAGPRGRGKETWMYTDNEPYERILDRLGADYTIYDQNGEGRWFLFGKSQTK